MNIFNYDEIEQILTNNQTYEPTVITTPVSTPIESIVYEITNHHHPELLTDTIRVEYLWKQYTSNEFQDIHTIQSSNNQKKYPVKTILVALDDCNHSLFLTTNIENEEYKYKLFTAKKYITTSTVKKGDCITFDSKHYHGFLTISNTETNDSNFPINCLLINLWDTPTTTENDELEPPIVIEANPTMNPEKLHPELLFNSINHEYKKQSNKKNQHLYIETIFEDILYNKTTPPIEGFFESHQDTTDPKIITYYFNHQFDATIAKPANIQYTSTDVITRDFQMIAKEYSQNRFLQRFYFKQHYNPDICKWMTENYNHFKRIKNIDSPYIDITNFPNVFSFFNVSFEGIMKKINDSYHLQSNYNFNLTEINIVSITTTPETNFTIPSSTDGMISFYIGLSPEPINLVFDNLTHMYMTLNQGDMVFFYSKTHYSLTNNTPDSPYYLLAGEVGLLPKE